MGSRSQVSYIFGIAGVINDLFQIGESCHNLLIPVILLSQEIDQIYNFFSKLYNILYYLKLP